MMMSSKEQEVADNSSLGINSKPTQVIKKDPAFPVRIYHCFRAVEKKNKKSKLDS
jgi:hypothetical protein